MNGTVDLGREAARRLVEPPPVSRRVLEMGGPHPTTPREIATALSLLRGSEVTPVLVPLEQVVPTFASFGIPESTGRLLEEMYAAVASGYLAYRGSCGAARPRQAHRSRRPRPDARGDDSMRLTEVDGGWRRLTVVDRG